MYKPGLKAEEVPQGHQVTHEKVTWAYILYGEAFSSPSALHPASYIKQSKLKEHVLLSAQLGIETQHPLKLTLG